MLFRSTNNAVDKTLTPEERPASVPKTFVAPTHASVDILKLLTELDDTVLRAKHGPFGILVGFDDENFRNTLMKIRAHLPEELNKKNSILNPLNRSISLI